MSCQRPSTRELSTAECSSTLTRELSTAEYSGAVHGRVLASCPRPSHELSRGANRRRDAFTQLALEAGANQVRKGCPWPSNTGLHDAGQRRGTRIRAGTMARRAWAEEGLEAHYERRVHSLA